MHRTASTVPASTSTTSRSRPRTAHRRRPPCPRSACSGARPRALGALARARTGRSGRTRRQSRLSWDARARAPRRRNVCPQRVSQTLRPFVVSVAHDHEGHRPLHHWTAPANPKATANAVATSRLKRTALTMSAGWAPRPHPKGGRTSLRSPYRLVPPRRIPRAAANAASATPEFGDGWAGAWVDTARRTSRAEPGRTMATRAAVQRAGTQLARSSSRALTDP